LLGNDNQLVDDCERGQSNVFQTPVAQFVAYTVQLD